MQLQSSRNSHLLGMIDCFVWNTFALRAFNIKAKNKKKKRFLSFFLSFCWSSSDS